jgi:hypothetical protein
MLAEAFEAIAASLPLGSVSFDRHPTDDGMSPTSCASYEGPERATATSFLGFGRCRWK